MLRVEELTKPRKNEPVKNRKPREIIISKTYWEETEEKDRKIRQKKEKKFNISKMINESAKAIKKSQTTILLNEMEKLLTEREGKK